MTIAHSVSPFTSYSQTVFKSAKPERKKVLSFNKKEKKNFIVKLLTSFNYSTKTLYFHLTLSPEGKNLMYPQQFERERKRIEITYFIEIVHFMVTT